MSELSYARPPEVSNPLIKRDDIGCQRYLLATHERVDWTNPFDQQPSHLVNISPEVAVGPDVSADLLHARQNDEDAYNTFQEHRLHEGTEAALSNHLKPLLDPTENVTVQCDDK